ncbi:histidinol dehydrogenase [Cardiobacteriaceae bacterium TAE3-ERU3]|nr:histidinol dehydrogenase [Cardiobacteriaceae bacterium TAE3-ERU3]
MKLHRIDATQADFYAPLNARLALELSTQAHVRQTVAKIIDDVRSRGDEALLHYSRTLDATDADSVAALRVPAEKLELCWSELGDEARYALEVAHERIRAYGEAQKLTSWSYQDEDGSTLGQQIQPLDSAGIYVPGGKASYPSSVLMNAVPAKVAGVARVVMVVPAPGGEMNPWVLGAAHLSGVDEVWQLGGAHAVAALAYGTQTIAPVDKITGPGNQYVAEAKRAVFGKVGIDMIAGPSEVVVFADDSADPRWIVADLFAQAEHDEMAQSILVTNSRHLAEAVDSLLEEMLSEQPRAKIIRTSLLDRGATVLVKNIEQGVEVVNHIAPEHLELMLADAAMIVPQIRHAGAIFVGTRSNEVFGDYCAGPNHVLPTSGTARFASPLGVYDFQKRSSVMALSEAASLALSPVAACLADAEGLHAHALSARLRGE